MLRAFVFLLLIFLLWTFPHNSYAQGERWSRGQIVIQVIRLDHADAEYLASVLAPFLSKQGRVVAYTPTNSLIIRDRASIIKKLVKIIKGESAP